MSNSTVEDSILERLIHLDEARRYTERLSRIPGIRGPYVASSLQWKGRRLYYVVGRDNDSRFRLVEVFRITPAAELEPVPAFQYPLPIRDLFPFDTACLYHPDPWGEAAPSLTTSQLADELRQMSSKDERGKD